MTGTNQKTGLILESGALRGLFSAGVADVLAENGIAFDGTIGVSAGALVGCDYKSRQIGRTIRWNTRYCGGQNYSGWWSFVTTGGFFNSRYLYEDIPKRLDIFDARAFSENPMEFYVTVTDMHTGEAVYQKLTRGDDQDFLWIKASTSIPGFSHPARIDGRLYSDGGTADSIPLGYFQGIGYGKNVVVATQPPGFQKKPPKLLPLLRLRLRKYPKLIASMETRHIRYNGQLEYIRQEERKKSVFLIQPKEPLNIKPGEKNPAELERVYRLGRMEAEEKLEALKEFLFGTTEKI